MAQRNPFPAGIALEAHKDAALRQPIRDLPPPALCVLSLDQGSGSPCEPVVAVGDAVRVGTVVARPADEFAATLHAPVSGRVVAIEHRDAATTVGRDLCILIASDGSDAMDPAVAPPRQVLDAEPDDLVRALAAAGIAGLGGAAFPTATKLRAARSRDATQLLLNGAECEPWVCCDDALMREAAADVVYGAAVLQRALGAESCVVAIEDDKPQAIAALRAAASATPAGAQVAVAVVPAIYPQGAERQLILDVFGVEVPSRGLPADVGVTCQNVATAAAVAHWARTGRPLIERVVTVTGSGVAEPCNVRARLGTLFGDLIHAAGGYVNDPLRLIAGGNMTGRAVPSDEVGLSKATNCVLVATAADLTGRLYAQEVACIRCGDCASACPAGLLPQQLHRAALADDRDGLEQYGLFDCIDCGACDYVCPSQIPLAMRFRAARERVRAARAIARRAAEARERFEQRERRLQEAAAAERATLDSLRQQAAARPGANDAHGAD
jgi:electron transport complex protein RnfC